VGGRRPADDLDQLVADEAADPAAQEQRSPEKAAHDEEDLDSTH
jgi:hypothetical protein